MTRRDMVTAMSVAALGAALGGCSFLFPARFRFRLLVRVATPQGERSGSGVMEASVYTQSRIGDYGSQHMDFRAEAVPVDLPGKHTLFALIDGRMAMDVARHFIPAFNASPDAWLRSFETLGSRAMRGRMMILPRDRWPRFVYFKNPLDPKTVEFVDPDNLSASFGPGYGPMDLSVQLTDDPITRGIKKRLPWLSEYTEPSLDPDYHGSLLPPREAEKILSHGDFRWGLK